MIIQFQPNEKQQIASLLLSACAHSGMSRVKYAVSVGLTGADLSNLQHNKWIDHPQLIGDKKWVHIARVVGYERNAIMYWKTATTEVYEFITAQLSNIQAFAMAGILVDAPGIGKTYAAKAYVKEHKNAFYLNCSATPTKFGFMRAFARMMGVEDVGSINGQMEEAMYILSQLDNPIVIIDEAGDLDNSCILLLKRIYNTLEGRCGLYLIGSDGLKKKIQRGIRYQVQGYTEFFSRFGSKYSSIYRVEDGIDGIERRRRLRTMATAICNANGITEADAQEQVLAVLKGSQMGDLRSVERAIKKAKIIAAHA